MARVSLSGRKAVNLTTAQIPAASTALKGVEVFDTTTGTLKVCNGTSWSELASSSPNPIVTSLPGSPVDGQECFFQNAAMAGQGVVWHLKYRSGSSSGYKWELVGGAPLVAATYSGATFSLPATPYTWSSAMPSSPHISIPLSGEYRFGWSVNCYSRTGTTQDLRAAPSVNGSWWWHLGAGMSRNVYDFVNLVGSDVVAAVAASDYIDLRCSSSTASLSIDLHWMQLSLIPTRVS